MIRYRLRITIETHDGYDYGWQMAHEAGIESPTVDALINTLEATASSIERGYIVLPEADAP